MTRFGYTLMTEQSGPRELVRYAQVAEDRGFDLLVSSDHYSPWLESQGHSPYAWTLLGAVAQATETCSARTGDDPDIKVHRLMLSRNRWIVCRWPTSQFLLSAPSPVAQLPVVRSKAAPVAAAGAAGLARRGSGRPDRG